MLFAVISRRNPMFLSHPILSLSIFVISLSLNPIFFFFNDTATAEIYALSLHDALPICASVATHDADDGAISVTITGLSNDLTDFNGGTYTAATGTWTGSATAINALTFHVGEDGTQTLTITASTTGAEAGSTPESYTLTVNPISENPIFSGAVATSAIELYGLVALRALLASPARRSSELSVTITGLSNDLTDFNGGT